ncbi:MAG: hypothetical protein K0Q73_7501 [Paenibacillus sp.]|jgi:hypothetical protein|nr:hypothetical protein [Paenibacillus sp.]
MEPIVLDGAGTIWVVQNGVLKYVDMKVQKVTATMDFSWEKVMGGDSGYAFHFTAQDLQDKVSIEVPRYSPALAELSQGAETTSGAVTYDDNEEAILAPTTGYTLLNGATLVSESDSVYLRDNGILTPLTRVATAPTAVQYSITAAGAITTNATNDGKTIVALYKWTKTQGTKSSFKGTRRPVPFKFIHRFRLQNGVGGANVPCQFTIYKALGGGSTDISQERKKATKMNMALEIMDPDLTPDNPNRVAAELIFGI